MTLFCVHRQLHPACSSAGGREEPFQRSKLSSPRVMTAEAAGQL